MYIRGRLVLSQLGVCVPPSSVPASVRNEQHMKGAAFRLQCIVQSRPSDQVKKSLSTSSVARNEREKKADMLYIRTGRPLIPVGPRPTPPSSTVALRPRGAPGQSLGQAAATWSDLDHAVSMVIVRRMGVPRCSGARSKTDKKL